MSDERAIMAYVEYMKDDKGDQFDDFVRIVQRAIDEAVASVRDPSMESRARGWDRVWERMRQMDGDGIYNRAATGVECAIDFLASLRNQKDVDEAVADEREAIVSALKLEKIAAGQMRAEQEGFTAFDWSGGNFDDAYAMGQDDGQIGYAREVLEVISARGAK